MQHRLVDSCTGGNGTGGWVFWTYDTDIVSPNPGGQDRLYLLGDGDGAINKTLFTAARLNSCAN